MVEPSIVRKDVFTLNLGAQAADLKHTTKDIEDLLRGCEAKIHTGVGHEETRIEYSRAGNEYHKEF